MFNRRGVGMSYPFNDPHYNLLFLYNEYYKVGKYEIRREKVRGIHD